MKLMIAIPCYDSMHYAFTKRLVNLIRHLEKMENVEFDVEIEGGTLVNFAREELVRKAINGGFTHVLWLDSDMIFEKDIVDKFIKLMDEEECDLVSGLYRSRHGGSMPILFKTLDPDERWDVYPTDAPFAIEGCGFGCAMTTTEMMQKILDEYGWCFMPTLKHGEDLAFCCRAKELGLKMMADPEVIVGHMGNAIIWPNRNSEYV